MNSLSFSLTASLSFAAPSPVKLTLKVRSSPPSTLPISDSQITGEEQKIGTLEPHDSAAGLATETLARGHKTRNGKSMTPSIRSPSASREMGELSWRHRRGGWRRIRYGGTHIYVWPIGSRGERNLLWLAVPWPFRLPVYLGIIGETRIRRRIIHHNY